jgi:hypothetical protein
VRGTDPAGCAARRLESLSSMGMRFGAAPEPKPHAVLLNGFSLHNGVHLHASDREGLAHLCGYGARPPLAQHRPETLPNGVLLLRLTDLALLLPIVSAVLFDDRFSDGVGNRSSRNQIDCFGGRVEPGHHTTSCRCV